MSRRSASGVCARCAEATELDASAHVEGVDCVCPHHCVYPERLRQLGARAPTLRIGGGADRLARLLERPLVAILGTTAPSDYGVATARRLAGGLARRGVGVAVALDDGIALAAHRSAAADGGATVAVLDRDVGRCSPVWCGAAYRDGLRRGCAVSPLALEPHEAPAAGAEEPTSGALSSPSPAAIVGLLADLAVLVECRRGEGALAGARVRLEHGLPLGVVPGVFDSGCSRGSNELLASGASVVGGVGDALRLLGRRRRARAGPASGGNAGARANRPACDSQAAGSNGRPLEPELRRVLERVLRGEDTLDALGGRDGHACGLELALAQLELRGVLRRSVGGRYLPSGPARRR